MGLDIVEYVMNVEEAFGVMIPDRDAERIHTPRELIDYLHGRAFVPAPGACLTQRAFYDLRRAVDGRCGLRPRRLRPGAELNTIVSPAAWREVGRSFGHPDWDRVWADRWGGRRMPRTLGDAAREVVARARRSVRRPGDGGRTWDDVRAEVVRITRDWPGLRAEVTDEELLDLDFVRDLG